MGDPYVDTLRPGVTLKHDPHFQRLWESVQRAVRHGATVVRSPLSDKVVLPKLST